MEYIDDILYGGCYLGRVPPYIGLNMVNSHTATIFITATLEFIFYPCR
jgi:hypothetical protein